jgi:hypothetical protein
MTNNKLTIINIFSLKANKKAEFIIVDRNLGFNPKNNNYYIFKIACIKSLYPFRF